jgi:hypothetical protein
MTQKLKHEIKTYNAMLKILATSHECSGDCDKCPFNNCGSARLQNVATYDCRCGISAIRKTFNDYMKSSTVFGVKTVSP